MQSKRIPFLGPVREFLYRKTQRDPSAVLQTFPLSTSSSAWVFLSVGTAQCLRFSFWWYCMVPESSSLVTLHWCLRLSLWWCCMVPESSSLVALPCAWDFLCWGTVLWRGLLLWVARDQPVGTGAPLLRRCLPLAGHGLSLLRVLQHDDKCRRNFGCKVVYIENYCVSFKLEKMKLYFILKNGYSLNLCPVSYCCTYIYNLICRMLL